MALGLSGKARVPDAIEPFTIDDSITRAVRAPQSQSSHVVAFLVGGFVITGGFLALLFADADVTRSRGLAQTDGYIRMDQPDARNPAAAAKPATPITH